MDIDKVRALSDGELDEQLREAKQDLWQARFAAHRPASSRTTARSPRPDERSRGSSPCSASAATMRSRTAREEITR